MQRREEAIHAREERYRTSSEPSLSSFVIFPLLTLTGEVIAVQTHYTTKFCSVMLTVFRHGLTLDKVNPTNIHTGI